MSTSSPGERFKKGHQRGESGTGFRYVSLGNENANLGKNLEPRHYQDLGEALHAQGRDVVVVKGCLESMRKTEKCDLSGREVSLWGAGDLSNGRTALTSIPYNLSGEARGDSV